VFRTEVLGAGGGGRPARLLQQQQNAVAEGKAKPGCRKRIPSLSNVSLPAEQNHSEGISVNISLLLFFFPLEWA